MISPYPKRNFPAKRTTSRKMAIHQHVMVAACLVFCLGLHGAVSAGSREYCQLESFRASCNKDEVILMKEAIYGRIALGRCLTRDYFVGCKADVLAHMDERCSGRQECEVEIPDPTLFKAQPCPKDLVAYLQADYTCVKVLSDPNANSKCRTDRQLEAKGPSGYLSSLVTDNLGIGTRDCPWVIKAEPGQQVRLILMDFSAEAGDDGDGGGGVGNQGQGSNVCRIYAYVYETIEGGSKEHPVCSGIRRETIVYTSKHNEATVKLQPQGPVDKENGGQPQFLIRYEAIGCPDPKLPSMAWQQRDGDKLDVMCNRTVRSWHLVCKGTQWVGEIGTCSPDSPWHDEQTVSKDRLLHFPNGILIAVMIGVALGIFLGFVLLSVIIMRRRRRDSKRRRDSPHGQIREENSLLGPHCDTYKLQQQQQQQPIYLERMDPGDHIMAVCPEHGTKVDMPFTSLPRTRNSAGIYETTKANTMLQGQGGYHHQGDRQDLSDHAKYIQEPYYREFAPCIDVDLTKNTRTLQKSERRVDGGGGPGGGPGANNMRTNLDITDVC